jgi:EpsI family protein
MARFFEGPSLCATIRSARRRGRPGRPPRRHGCWRARRHVGGRRCALRFATPSPRAPINYRSTAWRADGELEWAPRFVGAEAAQLQTYGDGVRTVADFVARYGNAWRGSELVNSENRLFSTPEWREIGRGTRSVTARGRPFTVNTLEVTDGRTARLVWYWYVVGEREHDAPWAAKLAELWLGLTARDAESAVVAVVTDVAPGHDSAATALAEMLDSHYDSVVAAVFPTRTRRAGRNGS